jgi:hypothetical protein
MPRVVRSRPVTAMPSSRRHAVLCAVAVATLLGVAPASVPAAPAPLATSAGIRAARDYALDRQGSVAFAVLDQRGRLRGVHRTRVFPSASVSKAMIMVAVLRQARGRALSASVREALRRMITWSDNDSADALYARVGGGGLVDVARAARATRFGERGHWASERITAADQVRLFLRLDALIPAAHRAYARELLRSIVPAQRWGVAPVAARHRMTIMFKGGWRPGVLHQVALLERGGQRLAVAVLTAGQPSVAYGQRTVEGVAARVLG